MSKKIIPEHVDPFRFAEQNLSLNGTVHVSELQRLRAIVFASDAIVAVDLHFGIDEQGITYIKGQLSTKLSLQCQRCMEVYFYDVASGFTLGIVNTLDEANALPEVYEPAMAKENTLALKDLIEDEIILNLPIIPKHLPEDCRVKMPLEDSSWEKNIKENPFHVLESLKGKEGK